LPGDDEDLADADVFDDLFSHDFSVLHQASFQTIPTARDGWEGSAERLVIAVNFLPVAFALLVN
jgi:hypothetical protein